MKKPSRALVLASAAAVLAFFVGVGASTAQGAIREDPPSTDTTTYADAKMTTSDAPSVDALVPYQSAIASFQRKMPPDETVAFVMTIVSPAESYATMIQRELESKGEYGITVTVTPMHIPGTRDVARWRIHGVSKSLRLGDLSEAEHHAIVGWAFEIATYFQSTLQNFAYRL